MTTSTAVAPKLASKKELAIAKKYFIVFADAKVKPIPYLDLKLAKEELKKSAPADLIESHDGKSPAGKIVGTNQAKASAKSKLSAPATKAEVDATKKLFEGSPKAAKEPKAAKVDERKISVIVAENPKRPGSASRARFSLYKTGMTVDAYIAAGGYAADVSWDSAHKFISLS